VESARFSTPLCDVIAECFLWYSSGSGTLMMDDLRRAQDKMRLIIKTSPMWCVVVLGAARLPWWASDKVDIKSMPNLPIALLASIEWTD